MTGRPPTDFARYEHAQLIQMLAESDPNGVARAGDAWADIARSLHERADDLSDQLARFGDSWQGSAADRHRTMITDLAGGMRRLADGALVLRDLVHATAEALRTAWLEMPAVADEAARREAVRVMSTLAAHYSRAAAAMPEVPRGLVSTKDEDGVGPAQPTGVFGRLVPAGLAAAAAALGGRLGPEPRGRLANPAGVAATVTAATAQGSAGGGAFRGGGGFRGAALPPIPLDRGGGPMPAGPEPDRIAAAGGAAAAASGRGFAGGVPPMPMGMMGGVDQASGSGRRVPPWLVDTEDIWGESNVVVPGVLGE